MATEHAVAKTYTHGSTNRRSHGGTESKTMFKSVLENPFHIRWPSVPMNIQNEILARVVVLLQGVAEYNIARRKLARRNKDRRRREVQDPYEAPQKVEKSPLRAERSFADSRDEIDRMFLAASQKVIAPINAQSVDASMGSDEPDASNVNKDATPKPEEPTPPALSCVTMGINEVTKRLEQQCRTPRTLHTPAQLASNPTQQATESRSRIRVVLACRQDVDTPLLLAHIPQLVAACNSRHPGEPLKLVPLPKGSDTTLAQAFGLRSATIAALEGPLVDDNTLYELLKSVPVTVAPWKVGDMNHTVESISAPQQDRITKTSTRNPRTDRIKHIPTHIKHLHTTAPKDMRAAKAQRAKRRAEAKLRRRDKQKNGNKCSTAPEGGKPDQS